MDFKRRAYFTFTLFIPLIFFHNFYKERKENRGMENKRKIKITVKWNEKKNRNRKKTKCDIWCNHEMVPTMVWFVQMVIYDGNLWLSIYVTPVLAMQKLPALLAAKFKVCTYVELTRCQNSWFAGSWTCDTKAKKVWLSGCCARSGTRSGGNCTRAAEPTIAGCYLKIMKSTFFNPENVTYIPSRRHSHNG